ncbi:MAG: lysozyme inhibitor LprI family protein [Erythrobacter sp.]
MRAIASIFTAVSIGLCGAVVAQAQDNGDAANCSNASTTIAMNECMAGILAKAETQRQKYASAAYTRLAKQPEVRAEFAVSEASFSHYRDAECGAVYERWKSGSIRGLMSLTCRIELTDRRSQTIWNNWLTFMDSTPPLLPEPGPSIWNR